MQEVCYRASFTLTNSFYCDIVWQMLRLRLQKKLKKQKVGKRETIIQQNVKKVLADSNQSLIVMIREKSLILMVRNN
jgi:hypothetical protein